VLATTTAGIRFGDRPNPSSIYMNGYKSKVYLGSTLVWQKPSPPSSLNAYAIDVLGRGTYPATDGFSSSFTMASWINFTSAPPSCLAQELFVTGYGNIWSLNGWHNGLGGWFVMLYDGSYNPYVVVPDETPTGWHLLVMTRDVANGELRIWVNGVSNSTPDATTAPAYDIYSSANNPLGGWQLPGLIDSQFAWDRALSNSEIEDLYSLTNVTDWSNAVFASTSTKVTNNCLFMHRHNEIGGSQSVDFMGSHNLAWDTDPVWRMPGVVHDAGADPADVTNGLIAWFKMDDVASDSVVSNEMDASGAGYIVNEENSYTSENSVNGRVARAFDLKTSSYVGVPSLVGWANGKSAFTLSSWIKTTAYQDGGNGAAIIGYYYYSMCGLTAYGNVARFDVSTTVGVKTALATTTINDGAWHHVAGTYDGANVKVYVDGILEVTEPHTGDSINTDGFCIGAPMDSSGSVDNTFQFQGVVDQGRLYDRALTSNEVWSISHP